MVLVCCPLKKKVESKVWRWNYWTLLPTREVLAQTVDLVNASIDSTEENSSRNKKIFISRRRKWLSTWSSFKEIVSFVFNKSTQETRRTQFSQLILYKNEMQRKRIKPKNRLQKELWHKIPKNSILSFTKVKLTVGGWQYCFEQVNHYFLYPIPFFLVIILLLLWMYIIFVTLNSVFFNMHREKYAELDFVKFISLEIDYFVGTSCFCF